MAAYIYIQKMKLTKNKRQIPFVCCKQKMETAKFCLFAANKNRIWKFIYLVGKQYCKW